jgi:hypothetical protein
VTAQRYEFRIAGTVSDRTRGAFAEMQVIDAPAETIIRGDVIDESHLHGILALLRTLGLQVVSMQQIPD